jgi:hypothetical protein
MAGFWNQPPAAGGYLHSDLSLDGNFAHLPRLSIGGD